MSGLDEARLRSLLGTRWLGRALRLERSCDSTNDEAAAWARADKPAPHGAVVIAEEQSRGRGRLGRSWHSPAGQGLYFSTVLRPQRPPAEAPPLTLAVAVALAEAVESVGGAPELKWPNDLLAGGRKLAGVLTEMSTSSSRIEFVVVGIGVNLDARELPEELSGRATSLAELVGRPVDREAFVAALCGCLERWYERWTMEGPAPVLAGWKARARMLGRRVTVSAGVERLTGIAEDLEADGALRLRMEDGTARRVVAGEIV